MASNICFPHLFPDRLWYGEESLHFFLLISLLFFKQREKVLLLQMIQIINMKRVFPPDEDCNLRKKFMVRLISHTASCE